MFATYIQPQNVIGQFMALHNNVPQTFKIAALQANELPQAANFLKTVQTQLAQKSQGSLLKTRTTEELQKYYVQNAQFLSVFGCHGLVAMSMVAPVANFSELGRVNTKPNLTDLPFNGLTEDVIGLHVQEAKPEDFCVFGAMAVDQNYAHLGMAQKLWQYRLQAALDMDIAFACTTISATNSGVLKHYNNHGWQIDDSNTIIENGQEITLHRLIANRQLLEQNLAHAQKNQQPMVVYA